MEFADVVRARRMVRTFDPDRPVSLEQVQRLLALAIQAPSAGFSQGWDFVVVATPDDRDRFWRATAPPGPPTPPDRWQRGMRTAPVLVICCSDPGAYLDRYARPDKARADPAMTGGDPAAWPVAWWDADTAMSALLVLLGAVDAGLVGCLFGVPSSAGPALREEFGIPQDRRLVSVLAIGHPRPEPPAAPPRSSPPSRPRHDTPASSRPSRRTVDDVTHVGRWRASPTP